MALSGISPVGPYAGATRALLRCAPLGSRRRAGLATRSASASSGARSSAGLAISTRTVRSCSTRQREVGADRLVNTVAAHDRYKGPLIVVDFGTATTLDVVDRDGNYCGGVIAPGINLSLAALHMAAAKLPSIPIRRTEHVIGKDTESCMQSGIYWGYVGLVEGLVGRIKSEFGAPMRTIATGGLAPLFAGATDAIEHVDPDLTLWGLRLIFERNAER